MYNFQVRVGPFQHVLFSDKRPVVTLHRFISTLSVLKYFKWLLQRKNLDIGILNIGRRSGELSLVNHAGSDKKMFYMCSVFFLQR